MIKPVPVLPQPIIDAVNNNDLAIFVGAGVSKIVGCDSWSEMGRRLVDLCYKNGIINFKVKEKLMSYTDIKKVISMCYGVLKERGLEENFYKTLEMSLLYKKETDTEIYKEIERLRGTILTTNADEFVDRLYLPCRRLSYPVQFKDLTIDRTKLYKLHGTISLRDSMVFKVDEYLARYNDSDFKQFLERVFSKNTILFIGYGLEEFELLDYICKNDKSQKTEKRKFYLKGFYENEESLVDIEQKYYDDLGIILVPYSMDQKGYEQILEIIKTWNSEIHKTSRYLYDSYKQVEDLILKDDDKVFQVIKNDSRLKEYYFRKICESSTAVSKLQVLKENGFFEPSKNPEPIEDKKKPGFFYMPRWSILDYLILIAKINKDTREPGVDELLEKIVNDIITYKKSDSKRIENFRTDSAMLEIISLFPKQIVEKNTIIYLAFIKEAINSRWSMETFSADLHIHLMPRLIEEGIKDFIIGILECVIALKMEGNNRTTVMHYYWLHEMLEKQKKKIANLCGVEVIKIMIEKLKVYLQTYPRDFWIKKINGHIEVQGEYLDILTNFTAALLQYSKAANIQHIVKVLFGETNNVFKKIALYATSKHYNELKSIFWNFFKPDTLDNIDLKPELYELFEQNNKTIIQEKKQVIIDGINSLKKDGNDETDERALAYRKQEWLTAFVETGDSDILALFEKYHSITKIKTSHPGHNIWIEKGSGERTSVKPDEFSSLDIDGKLNLLNTYKPESVIHSKEGLANILKGDLIKNPGIYTRNLYKFEYPNGVEIVYAEAIASGLYEVWKADPAKVKHDQIIIYMKSIIDQFDFAKPLKSERPYDYRIMVVYTCLSMMKDICKNDSYVIGETFFFYIKKTLLELINKLEKIVYKEDDLSRNFYNLPRGQVFEVLVHWSLRNARTLKKDNPVKWDDDIKAIFDKWLKKTDSDTSNIDFLEVIASYLPNMYYLDKKWVDSNFDYIFDMNSSKWLKTISGYLVYSDTVYQQLYEIFKTKGQYAKALTVDLKERIANEKKVQHICVGYLYDWEKLSDPDSLISKIIESENLNLIKDAIDFFWQQRIQDNDDEKLTEKDEEMQKKVILKTKELWKEIYLKHKENAKVMSWTSKLFGLLDEITDDEFEWVIAAAKNASDDYNVMAILDYLPKHTAKTPKKVADIYLTLLEQIISPEFYKEKIIDIVVGLYEKKLKSEADAICNIHAEKGDLFLREIYEKYNKREL
ncbi:MAG: SIR2 family protein [Candidatus Goldbacteria bacterium]|nr:SIR2 family protein [Candidatus Goldiibacteriota bacterium]